VPCFCALDMAASSIPLTQLEDITECPICSETFVDTRLLPCIHTFCLRCITSFAGEKAGDKVSCPLCRKEFAIPDGGMSKLPKNYFVEKFLEAKNLASILCQIDSVCDVCADNEEILEGGQKRASKAAVYCISCRKNMCKQCYGCHQQFKLSGTHKFIECNKSPLPVDDLLLKFPETSCDKHPDKSLEIYCFECKAVICMLCYIKEQHNSHKCTDVKDVADELAAQLTADAEGIKAKIEDCKAMLKKITDEERFLTDEVMEIETVINERAEKLKQLIDQHKEELLTKLITSKNRQLKENENVKQELERQMVVMENFLRYSEELKQKGTPCDIAKTAGELCAKGAELVKFDVKIDLPIDYTSTEVKFAATLSDDDIKRVFGDMDVTVNIKGT